MRVLVLGGTLFLGRAVVEAALARGDDVTIFTRGKTNPDLFPEAKRLRGDRDRGLLALVRGTWDAVIDTSGYVPRVVGESAELLQDRVPFYGFVSSGSAYASADADSIAEDAPTADAPLSEDVQAYYGPLKAACERVVSAVYGDGALVVRAGLIVGPHDPTNRFTYWVTRVADGGEVLAPGRPDRPIQFVDARDLAEWMLRMADERRGGVFNATGPEPPVTMGELLETCKRVSGSDARLVWLDDEFLVERGAGEWSELPLWIASPEWRGILALDASRAVEAGLAFRPLEETVRDTLEWALATAGHPQPEKTGVQTPKAGLAPERERELLDAWRARAA